VRRRPDPLPVYFVAPVLEVIPSREARWERFADAEWDPGRVAIAAEPMALAVDDPAAPTSIRVVEEGPDVQRLEVDSGGGVLVTSGLHFPGWRVWIDGAEAGPVEVDGALRGVALAPGRHAVLWRYEPTWLGTAWLASAAAALVAAAVAWAARRDGGAPPAHSDGR
jgi:hypothetical protein